MDLKVSWLTKCARGFGGEYDAPTQPKEAAKFRAEAPALNRNASDSVKK
jgi:hypothetical protein